MSRGIHEDAQPSGPSPSGTSPVIPSLDDTGLKQAMVSPVIPRLSRHPANLRSKGVTRSLRRQVRRD